MANFLVQGFPYGETILNSAERRTINRVRPESGEAVFARWYYGVAGRVVCSYVAYRQNPNPFQYFKVANYYDGFVHVQDIDNDGIDELLISEGQPWAMDCGLPMAALPHYLRITHIDTASGRLIDVSRLYRENLLESLSGLKKGYDEVSASSTNNPFTQECQAQWVKLLKNTYESAWYTLLLGSSAIAMLAFAMGLSRSPSWRWLARCIGAFAFFATTAAAIYSLGDAGWHVMAFSDFWTAFQVVTGFQFNSNIIELLSVILSAYAGWNLLTS